MTVPATFSLALANETATAHLMADLALLIETIAPASPAMALLVGTVSGSLIVAYSRGMIAADRRGKRRMLVLVILAAAISILFARLVFQLIRR